MPDLVSRRMEMTGIDRANRHARRCRIGVQLLVDTPFVRQQILDARCAVKLGDAVQVGGNGLTIERVVDLDVVHAMARIAQQRREATHRRKDRNQLLSMMERVVGFLPNFHQHVDRFGPDIGKPMMIRVQLIPEDKP